MTERGSISVLWSVAIFSGLLSHMCFGSWASCLYFHVFVPVAVFCVFFFSPNFPFFSSTIFFYYGGLKLIGPNIVSKNS